MTEDGSLAHVGKMGMKWGHRSGGSAGGSKALSPRKIKDQSIHEARKQNPYLSAKMNESFNKLHTPTSEADKIKQAKTKDYATAVKDAETWAINAARANKYTTAEKVKTGAAIATGVLAMVGYGVMSAYLRGY